MKTDKFKVIKAKYSGTELYGGGRSKVGDYLVMFPYNSFISTSQSGKKSFKSTYVKLNDLYMFPEFKDIRQQIIDEHGINPDTYGKLKVTWRR